MSKKITIGNDVHRLLSSLNQENRESLTGAPRRRSRKPANTAGELLEAYENEPPPQAKGSALKRLLRERGCRSAGRK